MNARSIRKHLVRNRLDTGFGRRLVLSVRVPVQYTGTPPPAPTFPGLSGSNGFWESPDGLEQVQVHEVSSHGRPSVDPEAPWRVPLLEAQDEDGWWTWWEGFRICTDALGNKAMEAIPAEAVVRVHEDTAWWERLRRRGVHQVLDALVEASGYAKATYWCRDSQSEACVWVTFTLKVHHRWSIRRFCAVLRVAMKLAKKNGACLRYS